MTREEFRALFENGPVILDGATGSNLMKAGMPRGVCPEQWILEHPQAILNLQSAYAEAGSQIVYAPTFTGSEPYLEEHGLEDRLEEINRELVTLSRKAVADRAYVAGDMTTVGKSFLTYDDLLPVYMRQATALRDSGVDLYVIETMMGLEETMAALEACRMVSDLPVMCSFTITSDGQFYLGGNVYDAAPQLEGFGVDAVGINCSCGPDQLESVIRMLHGLVTIPMIAKPNAGMPIIDEKGNAIYNMVADDFGEHMKKLYQAGATVLGGCCGTDPSYIRSLCDHLKTV